MLKAFKAFDKLKSVRYRAYAWYFLILKFTSYKLGSWHPFATIHIPKYIMAICSVVSQLAFINKRSENAGETTDCRYVNVSFLDMNK